MSHPLDQIVLALEPGADPIAGHVQAAGREPIAFDGWTSLFVVLRGLLEAAEPGEGVSATPAAG